MMSIIITATRDPAKVKSIDRIVYRPSTQQRASFLFPSLRRILYTVVLPVYRSKLTKNMFASFIAAYQSNILR